VSVRTSQAVMADRNKLHIVEALRGVAALAVAWFHLTNAYQWDWVRLIACTYIDALPGPTPLFVLATPAFHIVLGRSSIARTPCLLSHADGVFALGWMSKNDNSTGFWPFRCWDIPHHAPFI
jgi:hypothetical protein